MSCVYKVFILNILITGGASGLGKAITETLALNSMYRIYFSYNKSIPDALQLEEKFLNVKGIHCDFTHPESLKQFCTNIVKLELDVLINNAFTGFEKKHFHKFSAEAFANSFNDNVVPTLMITQTAIQQFKKKKSGKIITILTSALINKPPIGWSIYVANKAYLLSMSKSWATEYQKSNIVSNCISPSFMLTKMNKDVDERIVEQMAKKHPLNQLLSTEEVATSVEYLVKASMQINGINLLMNAGFDIS